jgi:hypothetical protein
MRLNELLDERASPETDRELLDHAEDCPDCAQLLAGHEMLLRGREWFEPTIGADFSVRVAVAIGGQNQRSHWRRWVGSFMAIAAGLLMAVGILHMLTSLGGDQGSRGDRVVNDPRLLGPIKAGTRPGEQIYPQIVALSDEVRQRLEQPPPEWVNDVADGLKPVADSMSAALHALRKTLPRGEAPVRSSQFESGILKIAEVA